jgi:hypothetical protein
VFAAYFKPCTLTLNNVHKSTGSNSKAISHNCGVSCLYCVLHSKVGSMAVLAITAMPEDKDFQVMV